MKTRSCLVDAVVVVMLLVTGSTEATAQTPVPRLPLAAASVRQVTLTDQEAELVELLDASLGSLADWSRSNRRIGGYILLGLGAAVVVGGVTTLVVADPGDDDAEVVGVALIGGGVLLGGLSLLPFKIRGEAERVYEDFSELPSGTPAQTRTKFTYGDRRFEELAEKRRRNRYINGAILLGIGIADLFLLDDREEWIGFGTPLVGGVTTLLLKTEEERRFESYQRAKEDILGPSSRAPTLGLGLGVLPHRRLAWAVQVRF